LKKVLFNVVTAQASGSKQKNRKASKRKSKTSVKHLLAQKIDIKILKKNHLRIKIFLPLKPTKNKEDRNKNENINPQNNFFCPTNQTSKFPKATPRDLKLICTRQKIHQKTKKQNNNNNNNKVNKIKQKKKNNVTSCKALYHCTKTSHGPFLRNKPKIYHTENT
jgi:hypothetical protein